MEINEDAKEKLGQAIDRLDNLAHGIQLPLPPNMHVDSLKNLLPEITKELKQAYTEVTGENPWEFHP